MAIRVLLDHNVSEDKIAVLSLLVSKQGLNITSILNDFINWFK